MYACIPISDNFADFANILENNNGASEVANMEDG